MLKILSLVKKNPTMNESVFRQYWLENYLPSILAIPDVKNNVTRIAHNHAISLTIREDFAQPDSVWGGVSEMWFDSPEAAKQFLNSQAVCHAVESHKQQLPEIIHLHCNELEVWNNGMEKPTIKLMAFFHHSNNMSRTQSQDYWTNKHVEVGSRLNNPQQYAPRYVQNHVLEHFHTQNPDYDFTGCPELWFYSKEAALKLFFETDEKNMKELAEDEAKFSDMRKTLSLVTDEVTVYQR